MKIKAAALLLSDSGKIISLPRPARHADIIRHVFSQGLVLGRHEQGFIIENGEFVTREEAFILATMSNQLIQKPMVYGKLHSEDVW